MNRISCDPLAADKLLREKRVLLVRTSHLDLRNISNVPIKGLVLITHLIRICVHSARSTNLNRPHFFTPLTLLAVRNQWFPKVSLLTLHKNLRSRCAEV